jgi:hypothetical protein
MTPQIMGSHALSAKVALDAVEAEIHGPHPGKIVHARQKPDRSLLGKATGHRQIMDIWLVQIAREAGAKLVTCDAGNLNNWPDNTIPVR